MHLVSTTAGASFTVNPHSCLFRATTHESAYIEGGTGLCVKAAGSFTGTVSPKGLLARNPDGSCAVGQPLLHEVGEDRVQWNAVFLTRCDDEHRCPPGG